jgi:hypothetical protein
MNTLRTQYVVVQRTAIACSIFVACLFFGAFYVTPVHAANQDAAGLSPAFMQWCQQFMATKRGNGQCKLACETRNPGAQVYNPIARQFGSQGFSNNNRTAIFPSVVHGIAAHVALIRDMCTRGRPDACNRGGGSRPRCTLIELKQVWAPSCHGGNNPTSYANTVASWVGIQPNQVFNPNDKDMMAKIALSSARIEVGFVNYTCEQLAQGTAMAYGQIPPGSVPADVGQLKSLGTAIEGNNSPLGGLIQGMGGNPQDNQGQNPFASQGQWAQPSPQTGPQQSGTQQAGQQQPSQPFMQNPYQNPFQPTSPSQQTPFQNTEVVSEDETVSDDDLLTCEDKLVEWSCPSDATLSRGISKPVDAQFKTRGALIGSLAVAPSRKTTYTVQCLKRQSIISEASCVVTPQKTAPSAGTTIKPVLTINADTTEVRRGKSAMISWAAVRVDSCVVFGEGLSEEGTEGSASTDELYTRGTAEYVLECRTTDGDTISKSVQVEVR